MGALRGHSEPLVAIVPLDALGGPWVPLGAPGCQKVPWMPLGDLGCRGNSWELLVALVSSRELLDAVGCIWNPFWGPIDVPSTEPEFAPMSCGNTVLRKLV